MISQLKTGLCVAAIACLAGALPAAASNTQTINTSNAYVDLSIAAAFVTVPTLCDEAIGSQNTSALGCNALGAAAVEAINGSGLSPDQYFESGGSALAYNSKNAFVPNGGTIDLLLHTGYSPIFSQHKYNLFGRGDEKMGPLSREEILFVGAVGNFQGPVTQTQPGDDAIWNAMKALISEPATYPVGHPLVLSGQVNVGDPLTKYSPDGGVTWFDIANISFYTEVTGLSTGGKALANTSCWSWVDNLFGVPPALSPSVGAIAVCNGMGVSGMADIYLGENFSGYTPNLCGGTISPTLSATNCNARERWVDQVVVGYIESFDDPAVQANSNFVENFRSQMSFDTPLASKVTFIDQNLEQAGLLGGNAFEGSRQTFQQAFATTSIPGTPQLTSSMGELVTQDVQGWFYSCLNCDSTANNVSHAFTPRDMGLSFMPYTNTWRDLPSISHGASEGNLSAYATQPGAPGP